MIDLHYRQISNIPMASYNAASLREFYDYTEKHLRALKSLGESNNQNNVVTMMKSKLPRSVLLRLEEQREENDKWTMESFRKCLLRYINIQEAADYQVRLLQIPKDFTRYPLKEQGQGFTTSCTTEAVLAEESGKQRQKKKRWIYCEGEHWSDEFLLLKHRSKKLKELKNRCFTCLKENDETKHWKASEKPCVHRGENRKHHWGLRPKKLSMKSTV